jgi:hypothetical protein
MKLNPNPHSKTAPRNIPRTNSRKILYPILAHRDFSTTPQSAFPI